MSSRWPTLPRYEDWAAACEVRSAADPRGLVLDFARSAFGHVCEVCGWDPTLPASAERTPPPLV